MTHSNNKRYMEFCTRMQAQIDNVLAADYDFESFGFSMKAKKNDGTPIKVEFEMDWTEAKE